MLLQFTFRSCRGYLFNKPAFGCLRFISSNNTGNTSDTAVSSSGSDSDDFSDRDESDAQSSMNNAKSEILSAALSFVPQHGWTKQSLILGAGKAGFPSVTHGLLERGEIELVEFFYRQSNEQLRNELLKDRESEQRKPTDVFIRDALTSRLKMLIPYIDSWPQSKPEDVVIHRAVEDSVGILIAQHLTYAEIDGAHTMCGCSDFWLALALMSLPPNVPNAIRNLTTLVDDIWYYAGDKSVYMDWYTKRISLAMVYGSTQLYMVQDRSNGFEDTWLFLSNQLSALQKAGKLANECQSLANSARNFCFGASHIVRNVVSANSRQR